MNASYRRNGSLIAGVTITLALLLTWTPVAMAALQVIEQSYEMSAAAIDRWPLSDKDSIVFRPCNTCERVALTVDANTKYGSNFSDINLTREQLLQIKVSMLNPRKAVVFIFYRPDDNTVTRIVLTATE